MAGKFSRARSWTAAGSVFAACLALQPASAASDHPLNKESRAARTKLSVKVAPGNWGGADPRDIQILLAAVADEFRSYVADAWQAPVDIRVVPRGTPRVLYERGRDGEYVVQLSARSQNWFQYVYQFSHELCHIFTHFDHKEHQGDEVASGNQWFEESLCETAALYTLKRLAVSWAENPPARQWAGYGPTLAAYAEFLQSQPHRRRPTGFAGWYRENRASLSENPYLREKNEQLADALLPLFEQAPEHWRAIARLNSDPASAGKDFPAFLGDWYLACPAEEREVVRQTMALFGFAPPAGVLARLGDERREE